MINHKILKKLAKSNKYQMLYNLTQNTNSVQLFNNTVDLSELQLWFLYYLSLYNGLYKDLTSGQSDISEEVIQDDLRTEAYLYLQKQNRNKKENKNKKEPVSSTTIPSIIFKKK